MSRFENMNSDFFKDDYGFEKVTFINKWIDGKVWVAIIFKRLDDLFEVSGVSENKPLYKTFDEAECAARHLILKDASNEKKAFTAQMKPTIKTLRFLGCKV